MATRRFVEVMADGVERTCEVQQLRVFLPVEMVKRVRGVAKEEGVPVEMLVFNALYEVLDEWEYDIELRKTGAEVCYW